MRPDAPAGAGKRPRQRRPLPCARRQVVAPAAARDPAQVGSGPNFLRPASVTTTPPRRSPASSARPSPTRPSTIASRARAEGDTPEGQYFLYRILRACATVADRKGGRGRAPAERRATGGAPPADRGEPSRRRSAPRAAPGGLRQGDGGPRAPGSPASPSPRPNSPSS